MYRQSFAGPRSTRGLALARRVGSQAIRRQYAGQIVCVGRFAFSTPPSRVSIRARACAPSVGGGGGMEGRGDLEAESGMEPDYSTV